MEDRHQQIKQYLQRADVQKRIRDEMLRARDEATVTISNAARLFGFSENQLRDWDEKGLLKPQRRAQEAEQDGKGPRRRQYTPTELSKLAIIHELMEKGKFSIGTIPAYVDEIWDEVAASNNTGSQSEHVVKREVETMPVDQRIRSINEELFWRYFASQALRLSLMLICEDIPNTKAGLILPLSVQGDKPVKRFIEVDDLASLDECLIGWMSLNRSSYAFLDQHPTFEHSSDFRVHRLQVMNRNIPDPQDVPPQNIYIVLQREAKSLTLSTTVVQTIRLLLAIVYEYTHKIRSALGLGMRDWPYQATDFTGSIDPTDDIMDDFADMVVSIGKGKWSFSCILLPQDISLPMPQHSLVVRAQSKDAPHTPTISSVSAMTPGLSFRAYQSGQVLYRADVGRKDFMIAHRELEEDTHSAIAIPLSGNDGISTGVLYIASSEIKGFTGDDERLLRLVGRMIEELLTTYRSRRLPARRLSGIITTPEVVDLSFREFATESDFVNDVEELLINIQTNGVTADLPGKEVSIIAVDIDDLAGIATKYGDVVARNLSIVVGERIQGNPSVLADPNHHQAFHINADRYYLLLTNVSLGEARSRALAVKARLNEEYRIDARRGFEKRAVLPASLLKLSDVTVRLSVHTYTYEKLKDLLGRFEFERSVHAVSDVMLMNIDKALNTGQGTGGNVIVSWDPDKWGYVVLPS